MINFKKILKLIVDIITYFLIVLVSLYLIFSLYNRYINKGKLFLIGKYYLFQIATGSMEHSLFAGDYIVVEKSDSYKVGDVITYMEEGYFITHRINSIDGDKITTKGDANNSVDNPISKNQIVGKLLFKERILTYLTRYKIWVIAILIAMIILESAFTEEGSDEDVTKNNSEEIAEIEDNEQLVLEDVNNESEEHNESLDEPDEKDEEVEEDVNETVDKNVEDSNLKMEKDNTKKDDRGNDKDEVSTNQQDPISTEPAETEKKIKKTRKKRNDK